MKLFLVRHGKSSAHETNRRQSPDSPLGEAGLRQAASLAERMRQEDVQVLFSSKWERAKQTAAAVSQALDIPLELFEGIHEREHNPVVYGLEKGTPFEKSFAKEFETHEHDLDWKFEGKGESLREVIARVRLFRDHLINNHVNQNVVVVTHEHFVKVFITLVLLGDSYTDEIFFRVYKTISLKNTGITLFEYSIDSHWALKYLNDHLHIIHIS